MDQKSPLSPPSSFAQLNTRLMPPCSFNQESINHNRNSSKVLSHLTKNHDVVNVNKPQKPKLYLIQPNPSMKSTFQVQTCENHKNEFPNQNLLDEVSLLKNQLLHFQKQNESLKLNLKKEQSKIKSLETDKQMIEILKCEIKDYRKLQDKTEDENFILKENIRKLNEKLKNFESEKVLMEDKMKWLNEKFHLSEEKLEIINLKNIATENSLKETEAKLEHAINCELTSLAKNLSDTNAKLQSITTQLLEAKNNLTEKEKALEKLQSEYEQYKETSMVKEDEKKKCLKKEIEELKMKLSVMQELASSQIVATSGEEKCLKELLNKWRCKLYEQMVQHKSTQMVLDDLTRKNKINKVYFIVFIFEF